MGGTDLDPTRILWKAQRAFGILKDIWTSSHIERTSKLIIFNSSVISILLYVSETVSLTKKAKPEKDPSLIK